MHRPTVTITGFRPFMDVAINPSAIVVGSLRGDAYWARSYGIDARPRLIHTAYNGLRDTLSALLVRRPDALVLTGYSRFARGLKLEVQATSRAHPALADAHGFTPPEPRDPPHIRRNAGIDFAGLVEALRAADVPADLSDDAGSYVCNRAYWTALDIAARRRLATRVIFVHLPAVTGVAGAPPDGAGALDLATVRRGIGIVANTLA